MNSHQRRKEYRKLVASGEVEKRSMDIVWTEEHEGLKQALDLTLDPDNRPNTKNHPNWMLNNLSDIICVDGFRFSMQASRMHYCTPKNDYGPWTHVELGYPNKGDDIIRRYADDRDHLTECVYPNVPIEVVCELILSHGGLT